MRYGAQRNTLLGSLGKKDIEHMKLSKKALADFKKIYTKEFGVNLSEGELQNKALQFLIFFKKIYKPIPKQK